MRTLHLQLVWKLSILHKAHQASVGGYSFLLDREQNLQQGAAADKHWREEKQKVWQGLII